MQKAVDTFVVISKPSHLGGGTYCNTYSREPIYGEGYFKIPKKYAVAFNIFNYNHATVNPRYSYVTINVFLGILLVQGCVQAGDIRWQCG